jgi:hypothetical protein
MGRARLLACAAAVLTAVALPSAASAQACWAVGSAQPVPPCIVWDNSQIIETANQLREKAAEIQARKAELQQYMTVEGVMGAVGARKIPSFPSLPAIAPLQAKSFVQAGTEARGKIATTSLDTAGKNEHRRQLALDLRAAAGDGYAIALATKTRFDAMEKDAASIGTLASRCSIDARSDWSFNTMARSLMLRAMAARREIDAAQVQLMSAKVMASPRMATSANAPVIPQGPAAIERPQPVAPQWSEGLGKVANMTNYLASLITARDVLMGFKDSIASHRETQQEYQTVLRAANVAQANMVSFANSEGRNKKVSGAALLARADQIMAAMDRTTWDDMSKTRVASEASSYAEKQLDGMVKGDVNNNWSKNLANRAEAFKQEAFYREFNADAQAQIAENNAAIVALGKEFGIDANNPGALDAMIKSTQNGLAVLGKQLDAAPVEIQARRDEIYKSTMETAGYAPSVPDQS